MSDLPVAAVVSIGGRAALIVGAAWLLSRSLAGRSAAARHMVWTGALAALAIVPVAAPFAPSVSLRVLPATTNASRMASVRVPTEAGGARGPVSSSDTPRPHDAQPVSPTTVPSASPIDDSAGRWSASAIDLAVGATWLAGMLLTVLRFVHGLALARRIVTSAIVVESPDWRRAMAEASAVLGLKRIPRLVASSRVSVPVTTGMLAPAVLVPVEALDWPADRCRVVLLHELAHVRRRDTLVQCLRHIACALHWWNPLVWFAARQLAIERERACDDLVLAAGHEGPDYAAHLVNIARHALGSRPPAAALAMARPSELEGRVMAMLDGRRPRGRVTRRMLAGAAAGAFVTAGMMASVRLEPRLAAAVLPPDVLEAQAPPTASPAPAGTPQPAQAPAPRPAAAPQPRPAPTERQPEQPPLPVEAPPADGEIGALVDRTVKEAIAGVQGGVPGGVKGGVRVDKPVVAGRAKVAPGEEISDAVRESVTTALTTALADKNPDVRKQALFALSGSPSPALVDPMIAALRDSDPEVRQQAAFALGRLGDARAVPALGTALKDADADVRARAAFAMGMIGTDAAVAPLAAALSDKEPEVRQQVAFALGRIGSPKTVDALRTALSDPDDEVRARAAFALGQLLRR